MSEPVGIMAMFGLEDDAPLVVPERGLIEEDGKLYGHFFDGPAGMFRKTLVKQSKKNGYWYREETFDRDSVKECLENYAAVRCEGHVVLDFGANVGGFSRMAVEQGAKKVVSIEPCPFNFDMLERNSPGSLNLNAAVTGDGSTEVSFIYTRSKRNSVSSSTVTRMNSSDVELKVKAVDFKTLLDEHQPGILKVDIEGAEYGILDSIDRIPDCVVQAAFEFHRSAEPFASYPDRFFPSSEWLAVEHPAGRFASMRDIVFTRR